MFVDRVEIETQGGKGGDGCLSFRRERYVPHGGPDGGDGGNGGSVIIRAKSGVNSLAQLSNRRTWKATKGTHGSGSNRHGRNGEDVSIDVPPGTVIIDAKEKFVIRDLANLDDQFVVAHGGKGGRGNAHFKSSTNQAPRQFSLGEEGESRRVILELKMIADVGLVGKPNAGKSTLLSRLSSAKPEIASYPFTTKYPNLGLVKVDVEHSFVMADIPGLIEGAHSGAGLGFDFLKHIERTGILVHLVEPEPMDQSDPVQNYLTIKDEMLQYKAALGQRPEIVVVSKCELPAAESVARKLSGKIGREVLLISAATGEGLNRLTREIANLLYGQEK